MSYYTNVVCYCYDCDVEWEQEIDAWESDYVSKCPECGYEQDKEYDPRDYE